MKPVVTAFLGKVLNATAAALPGLAGRGALVLYRYPRADRSFADAERRLLAGAFTGSLTVAGKNVVTYCWGDGERPVLLVHGWRSRAAHFAPYIAALRAAGYTPVAFDAPAHGASEGRRTTVLDYREIIARLYEEHGRFEAVVAHSLGGSAAFLALRGAAEADRLVVISGVADFDHVVDVFCAGLGLGPRVKTALRRRIEIDMFPGEHDLWRRFDVTYRPAEVTLPILLVHDEKDRMVAAAQADKTAAAYAGQVRRHRTSGLGHRRILADPDVVRTALDFVSARERVGD
ncbi:alpha/beta hydrolase [Streptomyces sp. 184]|uniref:alpha/beta hydrolase n=1 Tax=Streptomyces sp. 184 TaxID=1827526 RepID=UPI0038911D16